MGLFGMRQILADQATVEGARIAVHGMNHELRLAGEELERLAFLLRDETSLTRDAVRAKEASVRALAAAGVGE